ncbi:MAG TPA: ATP-binding protein [Bryobacteraceae bacterium]|jgi:light-regulated signal transduction histidine kinase (bacteriophytochrome)
MTSEVSRDHIESGCSENSDAKEAQWFLDRLVHDLRSAQRAVQISAEMLSLRPASLDGQFRQTVRQMEDGIKRMDAILAAVSNYSLSLLPSRYLLGPVSAALALRLASANLRGEIRENDATVVSDLLPEVWGDRDQLVNLFRHLISNSLRYRGTPPPRIEVRVERSEGHWLFSIKDNGIGIDSKYWEDIFKPFCRLHGTQTPGAGLGLAICRKILDAHHGTIWLESIAGSGTTTFFTLPIRPDLADNESTGEIG